MFHHIFHTIYSRNSLQRQRTLLHGRVSALGGSVRASLLSLLKWKAALSDVPEDVEAEAAAARESPIRRGDLAEPLGLGET